MAPQETANSSQAFRFFTAKPLDRAFAGVRESRHSLAIRIQNSGIIPCYFRSRLSQCIYAQHYHII